MAGWDNAVKAAMKILGDKGKIPKVNPAIAKARTVDEKAFDEFSKVRDELKKKVLASRDAQQLAKDAIEQYQDEIVESNLGLNARDKEDLKKIQEARKVLSDALQDSIDIADSNLKNLRELDKHLMSLMNYKQGS